MSTEQQPKATEQDDLCPEPAMGWREALFAILMAVGTAEGVVFESWWTDFGLTETERDNIFNEWQRRAEAALAATETGDQET